MVSGEIIAVLTNGVVDLKVSDGHKLLDESMIRCLAVTVNYVSQIQLRKAIERKLFIQFHYVS